MSNFNKLAARKEINAILHRLQETGLNPNVRRRIIERHLLNLFDVLPESFDPLLRGVLDAVTDKRRTLAASLLTTILSAIPLTYGSIPAGSVFTFRDSANLYIKRKDGLNLVGDDARSLYNHIDAATPVNLVNL